jgi:dTDP-4-dehydrorhamnose 3,5-epimerase
MSVAGEVVSPSRPEARPTAIPGAEILRLEPVRDPRGVLVEMCRSSWVEPEEPVQWNAITNVPGALRGMHWHLAHLDYLCVVHGELLVALVDLRIGSPAERVVELLTLRADPPSAAVIPAGVAHGFYSAGDSVVMYGVSRYWDGGDEWGVRFDDPELAIPWPVDPADVILSGRDEAFPLLVDAGPRLAWGGGRA